MTEGTAETGARTVVVIDTATDTVVTGIVRLTTVGGVQVLAERAVADGRRHAEIATSLIADVLAESGVSRGELAAVVVGTGPGPFTGLRVGMATGAAFGDALGLSVYGVCSLDAIAADIAATHDPASAGEVLVVTDARRREVYWALYRDGARLNGPNVSDPAIVSAEIAAAGSSVESVSAVGGSAAHARQIGWRGADPTSEVPTVRGLAIAARAAVVTAQNPTPLVPLYLRRPDAVERKHQRPTAVTQ